MKAVDPRFLLPRMRSRANRHTGTTHRVIAAGIDRRGRIITIQSNAPRIFKKGGGLHAEARIIRSHPMTKKIIIARFGKRGDLLPIDPCDSCQRLADKLGIKIQQVTKKGQLS